MAREGDQARAVRARPGRSRAARWHAAARRRHLAGQPDDDHQADRAGEQVGREREDPAVLPDAAQVHVAHDQGRDDRDQQQGRRSSPSGLRQRREGRQDRGPARRGLHRDRDHVVDHQRDRGHLGDPRAEVLPGHHVRAARPGVHRHHLAVGQHDQHDAEQDDQRSSAAPARRRPGRRTGAARAGSPRCRRPPRRARRRTARPAPAAWTAARS